MFCRVYWCLFCDPVLKNLFQFSVCSGIVLFICVLYTCICCIISCVRGVGEGCLSVVYFMTNEMCLGTLCISRKIQTHLLDC